MQRKPAGLRARTTNWNFVAPIAAYVAVFLAAFLFFFMIFRDAHLIALYQPGVDASSYIEAHTYIVLVEIALWLIMARAALRFMSYTRKIVYSPDGAALHYIALAMLLSFVYAIVFDMASTFKTLFMRSAYLGLITTITNLLPLIVFLLLSMLLFIGSFKLKRLVPDNPAQARRNRRVIVLSLAIFLLLVFPYAEYFYRMAPALLDDDGLRHFTLLPGILIAVYLLPFAAIWLLGLLSSLNLAQYARRIGGKIYRPAFRSLYIGILTAYISTYLIQIFYVSNVPSNQFGFGLMFIITLIFLLMAGYALMYRGADQLYKLEQ